MELEAGVVVAQRYRIQRQLGRGGMGEVFAAENIRTGRVVAVKVLRADSKQKSSAVARFRREARAAGAISSDYVTQVLDVEEDAEHGIVIVFELLEGESLIDRLKRTGPMTLEELFPIVSEVWMGLADAHKSGVIHRDLKPSNVFLERRNDGAMRVKILDFGISKLPKEVGGDTLTEMGQSLGTFSFMPPEQIGKAKTVDHRADIYAAATLIYQALSGQLPYAAKNILQMVDLKTKSEPRALASVVEGPVDPRLEAFLRRCLARNPEDRYQSAADALEAWRELKPGGAPRRTPQPEPQPQQHQQYAQPSPGFAPPANAQSPRPTPQPYPAVDARAQYASPQPQYAGAAAHATSAQGGGLGGSGARPAATVMIADPRSLSSAAAAPPQNAYGGQAAAHHPIHNPKLGGTVAMNAAQMTPFPSPASGVSQISGLPIVTSDTTSEGGADQAATVAMPLRQFAQARGMALPGGPSVPRLHDDNPDRGGTQLMSHAGARGGQSGSSRISGVTPAVRPEEQRTTGPGAGPNPPPQGEADLTTVYRREKGGPATTTGPIQAPPEPSGRFGMVLGVMAFALVGFAVAAAVIHYVQTGRMLWQ